ncbi:MAG TPA: metallopeptidase TldD-related protein [Burkholderiaceae bacterium]|nr:metallopeptidase TldD-related protein [Burkholderiaceae bacterium]
MKAKFFELAEFANGLLRGSEVLLANLAAEQSNFVRLNRARVRQPMSVRQAYLTLDLIDGKRRNALTLTLTGEMKSDRDAVKDAIATLRADLPALPEDPYLLYATAPASSERTESGGLPAPAEALDAILTVAQGIDLVGFFASGPVYRGFANSLGSRHWHAVESFNFDWSIYQGGAKVEKNDARDRAVKSAYAATHWDSNEARRRIEATRAQLGHLTRPARAIEPGAYRVFLAPAALDELLSMLNWAGVSAKAQRTKQSALQKLADGEAVLSPKFTLRELTAEGLAPAFDAMGFVKPPAVDLINAGRHAGALVSPRTAREYGIETNGAGDGETMGSMDVGAGNLAGADALAALDRGIYVSNLWYLNFSDRTNGRVTGMTRFATFWVENGKIAGPLSVMRFDDSLYRMLGANLVDLTRERDWILSTSTYDRRSVETSRVPGALLSELTFTL